MSDNCSSSSNIPETLNLTSSLPDVLVNLSSQCLHHLQELECYICITSDNISKLVCDSKDGNDAATTAKHHTAFMSVAVVTALLAIVLNSTVLLTIFLSRKLHTIVNYLVALLCLNQLFWTVFPVIEMCDLPVLVPQFCTVRYIMYFIPTTWTFSLIVTVTLVRYSLVVHNHSYPTNWQNILLFTIIPVLPGIAQLKLLMDHTSGQCGAIFATTSAGHTITRLPPRKYIAEFGILIIAECVAGFTVLFFCYFRILAKIIASRKLVTSSLRNGQTTTGIRQPVASRTRRLYSCFTGRAQSDLPTADQQPLPGIPLATFPRSGADQRPLGDTAASRLHPATGRQMTSKQTPATSERSHLRPPTPQRCGKSTQNIARRTKAGLHGRGSSSDPADCWRCTPGPSTQREVVTTPSPLTCTPGPSTQRVAATTPSVLTITVRPVNEPSSGAGTSATSGEEPPSRETRRAPPAELTARGLQTGKVDVIATMAMVTYLGTFILSFAPYLGIHQYAKELRCILMPGARYHVFTLILSSGGFMAVATPLVCVIFSQDFREAFVHCCRRFWRQMSALRQGG